MIYECPFCESKLFKDELSRNPNGKFHKCCKNGDIKLPDLPEVPEELLHIFRQSTYRSMSRKINHALAFACWVCHDTTMGGRYRAISSLRIQGNSYTTVGSICPSPEDIERKKLQFIQVFFNCSNEEEAIQKTAKNAGIRNLTNKTKEWLTTLHRWIRSNNPIYDLRRLRTDEQICE